MQGTTSRTRWPGTGVSRAAGAQTGAISGPGHGEGQVLGARTWPSVGNHPTSVVRVVRRVWDLNPRTRCGVSGFQDRCTRPLCEPSRRHRLRQQPERIIQQCAAPVQAAARGNTVEPPPRRARRSGRHTSADRSLPRVGSADTVERCPGPVRPYSRPEKETTCSLVRNPDSRS